MGRGSRALPSPHSPWSLETEDCRVYPHWVGWRRGQWLYKPGPNRLHTATPGLGVAQEPPWQKNRTWDATPLRIGEQAALPGACSPSPRIPAASL